MLSENHLQFKKVLEMTEKKFVWLFLIFEFGGKLNIIFQPRCKKILP